MSLKAAIMRKKEVAFPDIEMGLDISSPNSKKSSHDMFILSIIVFGWYSTAVVAITTSKQILNKVSLPFSLCLSQFFCASLLTQLILAVYPAPTIHSKFRYMVLQISGSYTLGFIFTNIAFSFANANFAETIKSAEPVSSVILGYFILREVSSRLTYATLLPICVGVALSCIGETDFNAGGFLFAALSNFCFSYRAVAAKQLYIAAPAQVDEVRLFADISFVGLIIMAILTVLLEAPSWASMTNFPPWSVLCLCAVNGCAYTAYNLLSFLALNRSTVMTHAVLNVFRRVVIIMFTATYFDVHLSVLNMLGVVIAVTGVVCFVYSKQQNPGTSHCWKHLKSERTTTHSV